MAGENGGDLSKEGHMITPDSNNLPAGGSRPLTSIADLPESVMPARDLWASIESTLQEGASLASEPEKQRRKPNYRSTGLQVMALAAVVAALAIGIWIGRTLLPTNQGSLSAPVAAANHSTPSISPQDGQRAAVPAAFITDPRYMRQRAALLRSHDAEMEKLPPETRAKVAASLATIRQSMKDLEDALGRDPSNALLQELLVNTYQDEMRVLTTVQASAAEI
jgi:hypothetical protein